jgi:hypothetical protein
VKTAMTFFPRADADGVGQVGERSSIQGLRVGSSGLPVATRWGRSLLLTALSSAAMGASAADLAYLQSLLAATPAGGWVKASTNTYAEAWATGDVGLPGTSWTNPGSVVRAWSSFAWDSNSGQLMLWGGGHANYMGNEMYLWKGDSGAWTRGSLPSRVQQVGLTANWLVVDDAAPQSAHTYDNNIFLPQNNMFVTFGGATFNAGGNFQTAGANGVFNRAGPWMYDPTLADANKVGGTTGSGYSAASAGGEMWTNRAGQWTGAQPFTYVSSATAYRLEDGRDVVYLAADSRESSGWKDLYRYTVGDVRAGGKDSWEMVGVAWNAPAQQGAAAIDSANGLFVRTSPWPSRQSDFSVWDLSKSNAANPSANKDTAVELVFANGSPFEMTTSFGMDYDASTGKLLLWDGSNAGTIYSTKAVLDSNGQIAPVWVVEQIQSTTASQPSGDFVAGVLGKWKYVSELGAFIALNEYNDTTKDSEVWLYKPLAAVPELSTYAAMLAGLGVVALRARQRRND